MFTCDIGVISLGYCLLQSSPESVSESREDEKEDDDADDNESGSGEEDSESEDDSEAESVDENMNEKSKFMEALIKFHRSRGTPIIRHPVMGQRNVDLFKLYHFVKEFGGMEKVNSSSTQLTQAPLLDSHKHLYSTHTSTST